MTTRVKTWMNSNAYRRGFEDGRGKGREEVERPFVIRLHMQDGRVLVSEDVVRMLESLGLVIAPIKASDEMIDRGAMNAELSKGTVGFVYDEMIGVLVAKGRDPGRPVPPHGSGPAQS
jgi:hypothetical protein